MDIEKAINAEINKKYFKHIPYKEKIARAYEELLDTDPNKIIKRWWEEWDNVLWGIYTGKIYLIGADTWAWKSTFINQVCDNVSNTGVRVVKYSLEDRMEDIGKEEIYYTVNRIRKNEWKKWYRWIDFVNNNIQDGDFFDYINKASNILIEKNIIELDKYRQVDIDNLVDLMEEECMMWTKLFAIDHLHYFEFEWARDRLDLQIQNVMHRINEVVRKNDVAVLLVAHYRNNINKIWEPSPARFKDWASIKQVANIIIQIEREEEDSIFYITKLRWPIKKTSIYTTFNLETFEYDFKKTQEQINKESRI